MNKFKLFVFLMIALVGITLSMNIIGCKKEAPMEEETTIEDNTTTEDNATMEDDSADMDSAEETE